MNYQCSTQFNVPTSFLNCRDYKKKLQESTDPLKYRLDLMPQQACFMPNQTFQGFQGGQRRPPNSLLDVENALRNAPLLEEENRNAIGDIHKVRAPQMPSVFNNKLIVPECNDMLRIETTKINKLDFPQLAMRLDKRGTYNTNYMRPGRDTRMEMRDGYKKWENQNVKKSNIFGIGKYDDRPLYLGNTTDCKISDQMGCMQVYGPDALQNGTLNKSDLTLGNLNTMNSQALFNYPPQISTALNKSSWKTQDTQAVAKTINPAVPYSQQIPSNVCGATFYGYNPCRT